MKYHTHRWENEVKATIVLLFFLFTAQTGAQTFKMIEPFEKHNWHWYEWGTDPGSVSYYTGWHTQGSQSLKLTSTRSSTGWNLFGTGCFDAETPDSIKMDLRADKSHRLEIKCVTSGNSEYLLKSKSLTANVTYTDVKIDFTRPDMRKLYFVQADYYTATSVYIDNIRTYKNGVETLWDGFENNSNYWDGSGDADNKNYETVLSDDITHSMKSTNFNSTAAHALNWNQNINTTVNSAEIVLKYPQPQNWSKYYYFKADIYRPSTTPDCDIFCFMWDGTAGTGTEWARVPANQWTTVVWKIGSSINMSSIEELKIVIPNTDIHTNGIIYIDNLQIGGFIPRENSVETASIGVKYSLDDYDGRVPHTTYKDSVVRGGYNDYFGYTGAACSNTASISSRLSNNENGEPARTKPFAWKIEYDVSADPDAWISYWNLLGPGANPKPRDLSNIDKVSLWIKGDNTQAFSNRISLEFHDSQWGNPGYESGKASAILSGITNEWQQWIIPFNADSLTVWGTFNPNEITEVVISLDNSTASSKSGKFYIDDIQFIDTDEVYWNDIDFDDDFLNLVSRRTFQYFIEAVNDTTGLVLDRATFIDLATVAGTGFGLGAIVIGVERGWITPAEAEAHVEKILRTLWEAPQGNSSTGISGYKGFFYHFLQSNNGLRKEADPGREPVELSVVDTGILMAGILTVKEYFSNNSTITELADKLYRRVDWPWFYDKTVNQFYLGWSPEKGFVGHWDISTDEVMLINLLAIGSPTHPVPANCFYAWRRDVGTYNNHTIINSWNGSLFQYFFTHCWFDLYGKEDAQKVNWWNNSVEAGLANRDYCIAKIDGSGRTNIPTYSEVSWGLSACEQIPNGLDTLYFGENGALPFHQTDYHPEFNGIYFGANDGTVPPYGAGSMIGFAAYNGGMQASYTIDALKNYYKNTQLWTGNFGFRDCYTDSMSLKPDASSKFPIYKNNFFSIDQGPMLLMIENYRSKLIWNNLMKNDYMKYAINEVFVPDLRVNDDLSGNTQITPATDGNILGEYVSVWSDRRENGKEYIYAQKYHSVSSVGSFRVDSINFRVNFGDTLTSNPSVAVSNNSNFIISWRKDDDVYGKVYDFTNSAFSTSEIKLNDNSIQSNKDYLAPVAAGNNLLGVVWSGTDYEKDVYLQTLNTSGQLVGSNIKVNTTVTGDQFDPAISMDNSDNMVVVWTDHSSSSEQTDIYLQRFSSNGNRIGINTKVNGSTVRNIKPAIDMNYDGKFVIAWLDTTNNKRNIYVKRFDQSGSQIGAIIKVNDIENAPAIESPDIAIDSSGAFIVVWQDCREGSMDIYSQQYDNLGNKVGYNTRTHSERTESSQIRPAVTVVNTSGDYQIIWQDDRNGDWDIYCPVGKPVPSVVITNMKSEDDLVPVEYELSQNYPNPFNPTTTIGYSVKREGKVNITVFDILGRKVISLVNEVKSAGKYEVKFNAAHLASGVYLIRMNAGSYVSSKKMLLMK